MSQLKITYSPAEGTLLEGSRKGDGAWEAIQAAQDKYRVRGWKYFRSLGMLGVSHSRDRAPQLGLMDVTADVLREAGFEVEVVVEAAPRAMEESEADRAERMDDRADALHAKAGRKGADADARQRAAQDIADGIPMGQPILVGHHSEKRHRRDMARIDANMRKSIELADDADRAAHGAATAEKHMQHREAPGVVYRRIEKLEADRRRAQRSLDGHTRNFRDGRGEIFYVEEHKPVEGRAREQVEAEATYLDEQIRYWNTVLDEHRASGRWNPVDPSTIKKGDEIQCGGHKWYPVLRVNKKTVTVAPGWEGGRLPVGLEKVTGHRAAQPVVETVDLDATQEATS